LNAKVDNCIYITGLRILYYAVSSFYPAYEETLDNDGEQVVHDDIQDGFGKWNDALK